MMKLLTIVVASTIILAGLYIFGWFSPGALNWGFHFLGFLPSYAVIVYSVLMAGTALLFWKTDTERLCAIPARWMEQFPVRFFAAAGLLFVCASILFRVHASLLGDSFTLIMNFRDYHSGAAELAPWHEPLSIYFLYYAITVFASLDYPAIFSAFLLVEMLLGLCFMVTAFLIVRSLFSSSVHRFLAFVMLLSAPSMEFFFGYVEIYSVSTVLLGLFILVSLLVLEEKIPFTFLPLLWLLVTLSHYINGVLFVSVLYLTVLAYKRGNMKSVVAGYTLAAVTGLVILAAVNFKMDRLMNASPVSHFLSLSEDVSPVNAYSQAYTLFSPFHLLDSVNYLVLMAPFPSILLVVLAWKYKRDMFVKSRLNLWFILALAPLALLWLLSKLEQGNASDWDVFAAQFIVLDLFVLLLLNQYEPLTSPSVLALIVCVSLIHSTVWFAVNASADSSTKRFVTLWDKRNLSHLGNYTMALRLTRYYDAQNDSLSHITTWRQFSRAYPDDPRGYRNTIEALNRFMPEEFARKESTYVQWLKIDPDNVELKREYSGDCMRAGILHFSQRQFAAAQEAFRKSVGSDSTSSSAYTYLGRSFAAQGMTDSAIAAYRTAIRFDSANAFACYNLGVIYADRHAAKEGRVLIETAARLGSTEAAEFLNRRH